MQTFLFHSILDLAALQEKFDVRDLGCEAFLAAKAGDTSLRGIRFHVDREGPYSREVTDVLHGLLQRGLVRRVEGDQRCFALSEVGTRWTMDAGRTPSPAMRAVVEQRNQYGKAACRLAATALFFATANGEDAVEAGLTRAKSKMPDLDEYSDAATALLADMAIS